MFQDKPVWIAHQRARWLRPDAHLFVRPDAHRFMPAGAPRLLGKDAVRYFWADVPNERREPTLDQKKDAHLAAARVSLLTLKRQVAALAFDLKFRRLLREKAYNPNQPQVPAGNPDGGQGRARVVRSESLAKMIHASFRTCHRMMNGYLVPDTPPISLAELATIRGRRLTSRHQFQRSDRRQFKQRIKLLRLPHNLLDGMRNQTRSLADFRQGVTFKARIGMSERGSD